MTTKYDIIKLKFLAAMGDVEAMYTLATNYLYGIGVEADLERAHSYLEKAVDKGFEPAKGMIETVFADGGAKGESCCLVETEAETARDRRIGIAGLCHQYAAGKAKGIAGAFYRCGAGGCGADHYAPWACFYV
jgi:TPR repeat protein